LTGCRDEAYYFAEVAAFFNQQSAINNQQSIARQIMKNIGTILAAWLVLAAAAMAQEMPKPGPELKKLEMFAGSWTMEGDMKPGAMGPGGKTTETEKCEWMDGGFFLVCHSDYKITMGNGSGISIMGYSAEDKAYTYREFNSWGEFTDSKGTFDGNTFTWTNEWKMGSMAMKGRFTTKVISPTSYDFSFEASQDGTKWTLVMDGKATKAK
jgi:hypothetical protein